METKRLILLALNCILTISLSFSAHAQKLPKVQKIAVRAPGNIKIDGKTTEWNDEFQAYNSGNYIYYTVSNDDSNLYLTLKTDRPLSSEKLLRGGITFTVASVVTKKSAVSLTFPAIRKRSNSEITQLKDSPHRYKNYISDTITNKNKIDSLILSSNRQIKENLKDILVSGIDEITEPLISIYNEQAIKVSVSVNSRMQIVYELAVPLKLLAKAIDANGKFKYNIKMNSLGTIAVPGAFDPPTMSTQDFKPDDLYVNFTTDFWGEYTLALK